jgi:hypothetical protein
MQANAPITKDDVAAAQAAWAEGVLHIGAAASWAEAHARATQMVQQHYLLSGGPILFCPTMARQNQFRHTLSDAVAYFVGRSDEHPEDQGFALQGWRDIRFENAGVVCRGGIGMAMGNYFFVQADGTEVMAEFSFVFIRDGGGQIRIQLHHSSLPYSG